MRPLSVVMVLAFLGVPHQLPAAEEIGRGGVYSVVELIFHGPEQGPADTPARDIDFRVRFRHEDARDEHEVHGFWDGDGRGDTTGDVFKVRFCLTKPGRWVLAEVHSSVPKLAGQHQGDFVTATPSGHHGFWIVDPDSPGRRWYRRSDGTHQYITGNTHYSFLSGYRDSGQPSGNDIAQDSMPPTSY